MTGWSVELIEAAERDLAKLDRGVRQRVIAKLDWLSKNFDLITPIPLSGEFKDFYKLRVGDWRAIYTINPKQSKIVVQAIDRRDKIYKSAP